MLSCFQIDCAAAGAAYHFFNSPRPYSGRVPHSRFLRVGSWGPPMPKGLKRYYGRGHLHFVTFGCYRRLPLLRGVHAKNLFLKELARVRLEYNFALVGYVVMPEHVHLLLGEPQKGTPSTVLQMLTQRTSRKLRNDE